MQYIFSFVCKYIFVFRSSPNFHFVVVSTLLIFSSFLQFFIFRKKKYYVFHFVHDVKGAELKDNKNNNSENNGRSSRSKAAAADIPTTSRPTGKNIKKSMKYKEFSDQKTNRIFFIFISRTETVKNSNSFR